MEAIMKIETPLHADHQLDQLAGQFGHWRQTRPHPHSQIPPELWAQAVALTAVVSPSRVAKQLRVRLADLKKQIATRHAAGPSAVPHPPTSLGFVEVPSAPSWPQPTGAIQIELSRTDGTRLRIPGAEATWALEPLVRAFLEVS
jgi:hypothetical protein